MTLAKIELSPTPELSDSVLRCISLEHYVVRYYEFGDLRSARIPESGYSSLGKRTNEDKNIVEAGQGVLIRCPGKDIASLIGVLNHISGYEGISSLTEGRAIATCTTMQKTFNLP